MKVRIAVSIELSTQKKKRKPNLFNKRKRELDYIPHEVGLVLIKCEKHKNRYRFSLVIIDAADIRIHENQSIPRSNNTARIR